MIDSCLLSHLYIRTGHESLFKNPFQKRGKKDGAGPFFEIDAAARPCTLIICRVPREARADCSLSDSSDNDKNLLRHMEERLPTTTASAIKE
jgi:hypothetical protein